MHELRGGAAKLPKSIYEFYLSAMYRTGVREQCNLVDLAVCGCEKSAAQISSALCTVML